MLSSNQLATIFDLGNMVIICLLPLPNLVDRSEPQPSRSLHPFAVSSFVGILCSYSECKISSILVRMGETEPICAMQEEKLSTFLQSIGCMPYFIPINIM